MSIYKMFINFNILLLYRMNKKNKSKKNNELINFYELDEVKAFNADYENPCYNDETLPLKHPLQMLICGTTGSGKSNILLNIIQAMDSTFNYIKIFTQNKEEQLYEYLESKIPRPFLEIYEGLDELNKMKFDDLEKAQYLFIFDDMCTQKDQRSIEHIFIRGRKMAQKKGISSIYLSQSYFATPSIIRKNINNLILKKINGKRDIDSILRETSIDAEKEQLMSMFQYCVKSREDITNFMLIDLGASDEKRFRKNFSLVLDVNQF
jgi:hypothetical protein